MASRLGRPNDNPPGWVREFACPVPCMGARAWAIWIDAYRFAARGADLKALQRGHCPSPCQDCDAASEHRRDAVRVGRCIPIVVEDARLATPHCGDDQRRAVGAAANTEATNAA